VGSTTLLHPVFNNLEQVIFLPCTYVNKSLQLWTKFWSRQEEQNPSLQLELFSKTSKISKTVKFCCLDQNLGYSWNHLFPTLKKQYWL
jgi:hypothetical protein